MAKRGRKRRSGRREPNGRLARSEAVTFDKGTERTQAKLATFGTQGADAIGRAYMAGLLGPRDSERAKAMLDTARKLAKLYRRAYVMHPYQPAIADKTGGSLAQFDHERIKRQEQEIADVLRFVNGMGRQVRLAFHALVLEDHPDTGPAWLDQAIWARKHNESVHPAAMGFLTRALDPLDILANGVDTAVNF